MRPRLMVRIGILIFSAVSAAASPVAGVEPAPREADVKAIRAATDSYVDAVNRGDLVAVGAFWTDNGDFLDEAGRIARGRDLAAHEQVESDHGLTLTVRLKTIRFTAADVAIAEGIARLAPAQPGKSPMSRFTAVWVRRDDGWLIDAVRESAIQTPDHHEFLTEIAWMLGDWVANAEYGRDDETEAGHGVERLSCEWSPDKNFILREIHLRSADGQELTISQRIGWDPLTSRIKSWAFDSRGGYGEGLWAQDGERWIVESKGVLPGGARLKGTHIYTPVDERAFIWESIDSRVGDDQMPDSARKFVRPTEDE
jgi:uncharacterized protein (TIGR02246 family)